GGAEAGRRAGSVLSLTTAKLRTKRRNLAALLLSLALLAPLPLFAAGNGTIVLKTATGDHSFNIEVMVTDEERALGLMFRRTLPENDGMLFLYDPPQPATMWMKNTLIPLDMVFISSDARVQRIEQ